MVRFDLGPLFQGQTRTANLKVLITRLLLVLKEGWESFDVVRFWAPPSSNDGSLALVCCLFGGYKFALGLVIYDVSKPKISIRFNFYAAFFIKGKIAK